MMMGRWTCQAIQTRMQEEEEEEEEEEEIKNEKEMHCS